MGRPVKDLSGKQFNYWTALRLDSVRNKKVAFWLCMCKCGTRRVVSSRTLQDGTSKSCGCFKLEKLVGQTGRRTTHGYKGKPIYISWKHMRSRCLNKNNSKYKSYGGRGIRICKRWDKFENFLIDMEKTWFLGATIERKNVNKGYTPSNCVWLTKSDQAKNKQTTLYLTIKGKRRRLIDVCLQYGVNIGTARSRIQRGWRGLKVLSKKDWRHP